MASNYLSLASIPPFKHLRLANHPIHPHTVIDPHVSHYNSFHRKPWAEAGHLVNIDMIINNWQTWPALLATPINMRLSNSFQAVLVSKILGDHFIDSCQQQP